MAAFGYWSASGTAIWYGNGADYSGYLWPRLVEVSRPLLSSAAWARLRLAAAFRWWPTPTVWRPLEFAWSSPAAAPRRACVRRRVPLIRILGARRPL